MFWGVTLETGKRYSQVVDSSYHLSMAALEPLPSEGSSSKFVSVMIEHNKSEFLLCTLEQNRVLQVALDHCFVEGEDVAYFLTGEGTVHLTGYIITDGVEGTEDSDESDEYAISSAGIRRLMKQNNKADEDSEDEDDEDFKPNAVSRKEFKKQAHGQELAKNSLKEEIKVTKKQTPKVKTVKPETPVEKSPKKSSPKSLTQLIKGPGNTPALDESSDDEEDEDFLMGDVDEEEESEEDSDNDEENSDWDTDEDEDETPYQVKKPKLEESVSKQKLSELSATTESVNKTHQKGSSKKQKLSETSPQVKTPNQKNSLDTSKSSSEGTANKSGSKPKTGFGGVEMQDLVVGNGPLARLGKMVHVYYRGTFPNKQEFDSCTKGKAFSFRLGKSEVIKGWDVGIQGMKVGGKRKLIIPPSMGYGNKVSGPIPPNSILHFEVELKAVS